MYAISACVARRLVDKLLHGMHVFLPCEKYFIHDKDVGLSDSRGFFEGKGKVRAAAITGQIAKVV